MTTSDFITKANLKHNNKYDYSESEYINAKTKIKIICEIHGQFIQRPSSHLDGCGCPKCSWAILSRNNRSSTTVFIDKVNLKHNYKYSYSKTEYIDADSKVVITCKEHGDFEQRASAHMLGQGCPSCGNNSASEKLSSNTSAFIQKANIIHSGKYIYTNTIYTKSRNTVVINCQLHGDFEQVANEHLRGYGCRACARNSSLSHLFRKHKNTLTTFYVIKYRDLFKVGITLSNIRKRYSQEVDDIKSVEEIYTTTFKGYEEAYNYEQQVIAKNSTISYTGASVFKNTGITEMFTELPTL